MDGLMGAHSQVLQRSRTHLSFAGQHRRASHPVLCFHNFAAACSHTARCNSSRGSNRCRASSSRSAGDLPVVDDATVLPPPPTGSQYAWRRSWAGRGASSSGSAGNGGTGGGSQGRRTRDWGSGRPGIGLLFILMYRMRLLLLYGAWVTVLYGAVHAVCDLSAKIGLTAVNVAGKASGWATGRLYGANAAGNDADDSSMSEAAGPAAAAAAAAAFSSTAAADAAGAADDGSVKQAAAAAGEPRAAGDTGDGDSRFASIDSRLQERPTARFFNNLMACVIPLYLMLLGSVCFFASL